MIRAVIFDLDGLIVDTETAAYESWRAIFACYGCAFALNDWLRYLGGASGAFDGCAELEARLGAAIDQEAILAERRRRKAELVAAQGILPGVLDWVDEAHARGLKLAVASSSPRDWVIGHLSRLGLADHFPCVRCAEDVPRVKPDPALYLSVLRDLGLRPDEAIALEDSPVGVLAAKTAGVFCVAVPNPLVRHLPFDEADWKLGSLADMSLSTLISRFEMGVTDLQRVAPFVVWKEGNHAV